MTYLPDNLPQKVRDCTEITSSCWTWNGYRLRDGYGQRRLGGKMRLVHRYVYELLVGPIAPGLTLDHLCRNRACINPAHLDPCTLRENLERGNAFIGRTLTHCKNGHPFDERNTLKRRQGRGCRACGVISSRKYAAKKKAA